MNKTRRIAGASFLASLAFSVAVASWAELSRPVISPNPKGQAAGPRQYVLIVDFYSLNCPLCTSMLASFLQTVKTRGIKNIAAVVVCDRDLLKSESNRKIIRKQVRGFALGFDIGFPLGLDEAGCFAPLGRQTAILLVIDGGRKALEKYSFPLSKEDMERILY